MSMNDETRHAFRSNPKLKKPGTKIEFTPEQLIEIDRCSRDPVYFIRKYVKIQHVDRGMIPFELFDYQEKFVRLMHNNRFVSARMARQMGKSATTAAYFCWYMIFNDEKTCAITANKASIAMEIMMRVQAAYEELPLWLQLGVTSWNVMSFTLENGSRIIAAATSSSAIRGMSISFLFMDEVAFIPRNQWDKFYNSVYSTISSGKETKIVMVSTPFGMNHFYTMHMKAVRGLSEFKAIDVTWKQHPDRDENWKRLTLANTSQQSFDQEFEVQFLGSAFTLINAGVLSNMEHTAPIETARDGLFKTYEKPQKDRLYALTADVAQGTGNDYSAFSVIDITEYPWRQVATFRDNSIDPEVFASVIDVVGRTYNYAHVLVETNDHGVLSTKELWQTHEYENLLFTKQETEIGGLVTQKSRAGIQVNKKTKRIGCIRLKMMVENGTIQLPDEESVKELTVFVKNPRSKEETYSAEEGFNDDLTMGLVNLCYFSSTKMWDNRIGDTKTNTVADKLREAAALSVNLPPVPDQPEAPTKERHPLNIRQFTVSLKGQLSELEPDELNDFLR